MINLDSFNQYKIQNKAIELLKKDFMIRNVEY